MHSAPIPSPSPGLNLGDVYFVLFRHKWRIMLCALIGVATAAVVYIYDPPAYQSEAKLFVRYIISENKALGPASPEQTAKSPDQRGETIMKSEAEILGSLDLARQVVESIGPQKILGRAGGNDSARALATIKNNLAITVAPDSTVIHVVFKHPDPTIVQPVLREVIERYLKLHVETHTASGMLGDFLSQETDQLRTRLSQTEEELRKATSRAGVITLEDAKQAYAAQIAGIRRELFSAQAELAQRQAVRQELTRREPASDPADPEPPVPAEALAEYRAVTTHLESMQQIEQQLLTQFTPENARVKELRADLAQAEAQQRALQERYPRLLQSGVAKPHPQSEAPDPASVATQITALQARITVLNSQLEQVRAEVAKMEQMEGTIVELRRKKELEEANYRYYSANLEQSRINETLGNGRVSNISQIQTPSPPFRDTSHANKLLGLILASGLLGGIAWAFLIELYFDRSIKRAVDIERMLRVPLFISIPTIRHPALKGAPRLLLTGPNGNAANGTNGHALTATPAIGPLQVFHDTLRDRLIAYFESVNLTHKPKLVAITGLGDGAGVTTTAAGLARSLSETGEGNVLLVDMNAGEGVAQQFVRGREVCGLDEMLNARDNAHVEEKLYVVSENNSDRLTQSMPRRFTKLVPKLKASDFDYILFDMPPVNQISITPRLAGFMDMVLVVVESERTGRDVMQRATSLLGETRAHVGVVLNKTRNYVPARLYQESLGN